MRSNNPELKESVGLSLILFDSALLFVFERFLAIKLQNASEQNQRNPTSKMQ